jgi:hypothetical protein
VSTPTKHGGKREGAGRKPLPEQERRVQIAATVAPITADWLLAQRRPELGIGRVIDDLVAEKMSRDDPAEYEPLLASTGTEQAE